MDSDQSGEGNRARTIKAQRARILRRRERFILAAAMGGIASATAACEPCLRVMCDTPGCMVPAKTTTGGGGRGGAGGADTTSTSSAAGGASQGGGGDSTGGAGGS